MTDPADETWRGGRWRRLRSLFRPDLESDVDDEIAFHLDMRARDLAAGPDDPSARAEAERLFGDVHGVREAVLAIDERMNRRKRRRELLGDLMQDFGYAIRVLRKSPAFALMAIACVALGVCVTTTIFSAVNSVLLRPLPYPGSDELVAIYARLAHRNINGANVAYPDYESWRAENTTFSNVGLYTWSSHTLSGDDEAERVDGAQVTASLLETLGVTPLLGRTITRAEEKEGNDAVVVLGYGLWQRRYAGDRDIVGSTIEMDARPYTVVGVMPPGFTFPASGQLWVPLVQEEWMRGRGNRGLAGAVARLKPGRTLVEAQADLDVISKRLQQAYPRENFGWDAEAITMREDVVGELRRPLLVFQGAVALVLLIACANVANLMLARATTRQRELAIRLALGAGKRRIAGQLLAEAFVIAAAGGLAGVALSVAGVRLLSMAFPDRIPAFISIELDRTAIAFAVLVALATGLLFGLLPALRASKTDMNGWLRQGARAGGGRAAGRLRNALVVAEVALSLVVLVGATLLVRSYRTLTDTTLGFDDAGVLTARVSLPPATYADADRRLAAWQTLYERLAGIPGVTSVGSANGIPFSGWNVQAEFSIEGRPAPAQGQELDVHYQTVSPAFFETIGVPLVRGRMFTPADRDPEAHIAVINQLLADREFPGEDPIGRRMKQGGVASGDSWFTIVGVVGTYRHYRLPQPMGPAIYFPALADPAYTQTLVVRTTAGDAASLVPSLRAVLRDVDPTVPAYRVQTLEEAVSTSLWRQRFQSEVLGVFAALALALALVGMYGVISYAVAQRTRELGVRVALGAGRGHVLRSVVGQGVRLASLGVAIGLASSFALRGVVAGLLYGVSATDPATFVLVPASLMAVAALASWIPARRATRVDPMTALRAE